jgi:3'(2'), 5'-bisphosphate nucleotidase
MTTADDHALAADLARRAGELLIALRERATELAHALGDEGDRRSHELIMAALADSRPDDAVLSEEGADDSTRLEADRVWIVDPLDGTREFGEPPRTDWAVHVALWERAAAGDGHGLTAGAVALPALGQVLATADSPAATTRHTGPPRLVVSRSRPPAAATHLRDALGGILVEMGSAGAKTMAILRDEADVYAHSGGQFEWDSAAPVAVAAAAGLHVSRIDGSALSYNSADPYLPDLLVCRPDLAAPALDALASFDP